MAVTQLCAQDGPTLGPLLCCLRPAMINNFLAFHFALGPAYYVQSGTRGDADVTTPCRLLAALPVGPTVPGSPFSGARVPSGSLLVPLPASQPQLHVRLQQPGYGTPLSKNPSSEPHGSKEQKGVFLFLKWIPELKRNLLPVNIC